MCDKKWKIRYNVLKTLENQLPNSTADGCSVIVQLYAVSVDKVAVVF
jgi:hypothetical protein